MAYRDLKSSKIWVISKASIYGEVIKAISIKQLATQTKILVPIWSLSLPLEFCLRFWSCGAAGISEGLGHVMDNHFL